MSNKTINNNQGVKIRIIIADDHPLVRYALKSLLETQEDMQVVTDAEDGEEAVRLVGRLKPDVVLLDISMPKMNGLEATKLIKQGDPDIAVLVLTVYDDKEHLLEILKAGADGYLTKRANNKDILESIRAIAAGEVVFSRELFKQILDNVIQYPTPEVDGLKLKAVDILTVREISILRNVARGMSNKEIAAQLNIGIRTVKGYLAIIFSKLNIRSRTEAAILALRLGIIKSDDLE